ncbi:MAG: DUF134 domain-containing protein [Ignavibacteriales bacterium]|nr:DUF134 domain-containing protein [Ignavibacteriales bacterium]MBK7981412.1 DUF134 domain-containing protein [Ignavibacteriota bacterium]
MPRPKKNRCLFCNPVVYYYKPQGIPLRLLEEINLERDEFEAINLADLENLSHEEAAKKMKISRATFGRIIKSARNKIAESMIMGKAIKINK